ncbi:hypothetical protein RSC3_04558 [Bacillus paralicheniformis]|nr:hypothetical protein RSC3_04558 [Bacillus paralicheniformis]
MEIGQVSPVYLHDLSLYQKILSQRNHFLKQLQTRKQTDQTMLDVLTEQLTEFAAKVVMKRLQFVDQLEKWAQPIHSGISRGLEELTLKYHTSLHVSDSPDLSKMINSYQETFSKLRDKEIERGYLCQVPTGMMFSSTSMAVMCRLTDRRASSERLLCRLNWLKSI